MARFWKVAHDTQADVPGFMPPEDSPLPYWSQQVLAEAECDKLFFQVMERYTEKRLSRVYKLDGTGDQLDLSVRHTHYYNPFTLPDGEYLNRVINGAASECARRWWGKEAVPATPLQVLGYEERCRFRSHCDNSLFQVNRWVRNDPLRDLTGLLYLSDWTPVISRPNQFQGGELIFENLWGVDNKKLVVYPRKGLFVAFPSHPIFTHQVPLITRGYRIATVNWWTMR